MGQDFLGHPGVEHPLILEFLCSLVPATGLKCLGTVSVKTEMKKAPSTLALPAFTISLKPFGKQARTFLD